jgi:hypothetical protein
MALEIVNRFDVVGSKKMAGKNPGVNITNY